MSNDLPDYSAFRWGGTYFPLQPDSGQPLPKWAEYGALLRDADPARFFFIDFLTWSLQHFLEQRLVAEAKRAGAPISCAVAAVSLVDPVAFFTPGVAMSFRFPLLSVYRRRSRGKYVSTIRPFRQGIWDVSYILPALSYEQAQKLDPILASVEKTIDATVEQGFHPLYAPPAGRPNDYVWGAGGQMEIGTDDQESIWDWMQDTKGTVFLRYKTSLLVKERRMDLRSDDPGAPVPLTAFDASVALVADATDQNPIPIVRTTIDET